MTDDPERTGDVRLCLATRLFYPLYGGGALRFARYLPGLASRGVDTHVFTATAGEVRGQMAVVAQRQDRAESETPSIDVVNGARVHRVQLRDDSGDFRRGLAFGRALVRHCLGEHRPDVIQLLSLPLPLLPALYQLRAAGLPVISAITVSPSADDRPLSWLGHRLQTFPARAVERLIVSSDTMRRRLEVLGVRTPMVVIPNGVDIDRFRPPEPGEDAGRRLRMRLGIPSDATIVLTAGGVIPRKGIEFLLDAWHRVARTDSRAHLVIAGPRRDLIDPRFAAFKQTIAGLLEAPGSDRVHFAGLVEDIEAFYRGADVFVFTSKREGMPNAFLEAMASGLPIVTTEFIGRTEELGRAGEHYALAERESGRFASAITALLADDAARMRLGHAARDWVSTRMTLAASLDRYAETYREIANRRSRAVRRATVAAGGVE